MHTDRFRPIGKWWNGNQHIIQWSDEKNSNTQNSHDVPHPPYIFIVTVYITDGLYKSGISNHFLIFRRTILLYHCVYPGIHYRLIGSGTKTDERQPAVAASPWVISPFTAPYRRQRNHRFRPYRRILRYISIGAFYRKFYLFTVWDNLAYRILCVEHLSCQTVTQVNYIFLG